MDLPRMLEIGTLVALWGERENRVVDDQVHPTRWSFGEPRDIAPQGSNHSRQNGTKPVFDNIEEPWGLLLHSLLWIESCKQTRTRW